MSFEASGENSAIGFITILCGWGFTSIALASIIFLILARRLHHGHYSLEVDDILLITAFIFTVLLISQTTWAIIDEGQGRHVADVSRTQISLVARSLISNEVLWGFINTLIRISVLIFIRKIFVLKNQGLTSQRFISNVLLSLSAVYGVVLVLEALLICRPISAAWDQSIKGSCGNEVLAYVVLEILGLVIDLGIAVSPIPAIFRLQISSRHKFWICITFLIGILIVVITGLRIKALHIVNSVDFTYSKGYIGLLSALGALISIILCCVPALPILMKRLMRIPKDNTSTKVRPPSVRKELPPPDLSIEHPVIMKRRDSVENHSPVEIRLLEKGNEKSERNEHGPSADTARVKETGSALDMYTAIQAREASSVQRAGAGILASDGRASVVH